MKDLLPGPFVIWFLIVFSGCAAAPHQTGITSASQRGPAAGEIANPREQLWIVVRDQCLATEGAPQAQGSPCVKTDSQAGYLVLRDRKSETHHLLIPTSQIRGIEDPALLGPKTPNLWSAAWSATSFIERAVGKPIPREFLGLAINPAFNRSQDQLHIHMDCLQPDVVSELSARRSSFKDPSGHHQMARDDFAISTVTLRNVSYRVRVLRSLTSPDPFRILASELGNESPAMANHTMIVIGTHLRDGRPGFLLLDRDGTRDGQREGQKSLPVHGEDVQDFSCAVMRVSK